MTHPEKTGSTEPPEGPLHHLPNIGDKPIRPRRKRWGKKTFAITGTVFVVGAVGIRLLQHFEPGPQPVVVQQPTIESLASLAIKKGFPGDCLGDPIKGPFADDLSHNPNEERLWCIYTGHPSGQPDPVESCRVRLERDAWADTYHFGFSVVGSSGDLIYFGKDSAFSEIPAKAGLPAACAQENITIP